MDNCQHSLTIVNIRPLTITYIILLLIAHVFIHIQMIRPVPNHMHTLQRVGLSDNVFGGFNPLVLVLEIVAHGTWCKAWLVKV